MDKLSWKQVIWTTLAITFLIVLTSCSQLVPLMGEGPPPGYIGGNIPAEYRGKANPFAPNDEQALAAGRQLYQANCAVCHGDNGRGDGPKWPYLEPRPADFSTPAMQEAFREHEDYVFWWVSEGVEQTSMPAFKDRLSEIERWQVITYDRYLGEQARK